jgi:hypothetical protein
LEILSLKQEENLFDYKKKKLNTTCKNPSVYLTVKMHSNKIGKRKQNKSVVIVRLIQDIIFLVFAQKLQFLHKFL